MVCILHHVVEFLEGVFTCLPSFLPFFLSLLPSISFVPVLPSTQRRVHASLSALLYKMFSIYIHTYIHLLFFFFFFFFFFPFFNFFPSMVLEKENKRKRKLSPIVISSHRIASPYNPDPSVHPSIQHRRESQTEARPTSCVPKEIKPRKSSTSSSSRVEIPDDSDAETNDAENADDDEESADGCHGFSFIYIYIFLPLIFFP